MRVDQLGEWGAMCVGLQDDTSTVGSGSRWFVEIVSEIVGFGGDAIVVAKEEERANVLKGREGVMSHVVSQSPTLGKRAPFTPLSL